MHNWFQTNFPVGTMKISKGNEFGKNLMKYIKLGQKIVIVAWQNHVLRYIPPTKLDSPNHTT